MYGRLKNGGSILAWAARAALQSQAEKGGARSLGLLQGASGPLGAVQSPLPCQVPASGPWTWRDAGSSLSGQQLAFMGGGPRNNASKSQKGKGAAATTAAGGGEEGEEFDLEPYKNRMTASLEQLQRDLGGVRTSANPRLLDAVHVESPKFGTRVPLRSLGTVVVRNPQLMVVEVYDKEETQAVAKAIETSPLKLQTRVEAGEVLVIVPRMTMEVVEKMAKLAKEEGETAKGGIRRERHAALDYCRKKIKHANKDEQRRREKKIQDLTDSFTAEVDKMVAAKVEDLRKNH